MLIVNAKYRFMLMYIFAVTHCITLMFGGNSTVKSKFLNTISSNIYSNRLYKQFAHEGLLTSLARY